MFKIFDCNVKRQTSIGRKIPVANLSLVLLPCNYGHPNMMSPWKPERGPWWHNRKFVQIFSGKYWKTQKRGLLFQGKHW